LLKAGFQNVKRLHGGLEAWQQHIDPNFPI